VSPAVRVEADPADASLAGSAPGSGSAAEEVTVALGDFAAAGAPDVRWLDRASRPDDTAGSRVIAPAGDGVWRAAPWPAADALFELPERSSGAVAVTGADTGLRDAVASRAGARGLDAEIVERLDADVLARVGVVVIAERPGAALPARAFAALAARRLLLVPRLDRTFGLEDGLDHLQFAGPDEALLLLAAHARNASAFDRVLAWGRLKAEPQRASVVYGRLAAGLRADGLA